MINIEDTIDTHTHTPTELLPQTKSNHITPPTSSTPFSPANYHSPPFPLGITKNQTPPSPSTMPPSPPPPSPSSFLPSLGHASSGALGTLVSALATYPLDLVNTRLKVQRQLRADGAIREADTYDGVADAFAKIYAHEGGARAFFAGLGVELGKAGADSFLWFLFYNVSPHPFSLSLFPFYRFSGLRVVS